ncbi:MAG: T9SS type A sorting domain-containing protein [Bacteroidota bacterium]
MLGRLAIFSLFCIFTFTQIKAQNCASAVPIPFPATDASPFASSLPAALTATCNPIPNPGPAVDVDGGSPCTIGVCAEEAWFFFVPNETTQQNLHFQLSTDFNGRIKWVLLYSESVDASTSAFPHCFWTNPNSTNLTQRGSGCADALTGVPIDFLPEGLDGTGYFFLLVQSETPTGGGSITVALRKQVGNPTVAAPANDRCATPTLMQTPTAGGLGVDDLYATGGSSSWLDALSGTTKGATKQRQIVQEGLGGRNEDTYEFSTLFGDVYSNNTIDDTDDLFFGVTEGCISNIDNSIYYTVTPPATDNWYLHIGNLACSWGPDTIQLMITTAGGLDCTDASLTTLLAAPDGCHKIGATGTYPSADLSIGPLSLSGGLTYGIIIDGKQSAQCDFEMILTTSPTINAVLPFHFNDLSAQLNNGLPELSWTINSLQELDHFEIERSLDGLGFHSFGERSVLANQRSYSWLDLSPLPGTSYYRIVAIDQNGVKTYSDRLQIGVEIPAFTLQSLWYDANQLRLSYNYGADQAFRWELLDITGRTLEQGRWESLRGTTSQVIKTRDLAAGVYFFRLQGEKGILSRKFLVE